ncbi:MAG: undecaprenyl-diphosphate phosphatase [Butyrivibrio sp.]|nr:undecaprenyl-diphosphate phosphatase [Butyrivibrio sp.]
MNILKSIFLGIIQGLTEFLPVSSSGHLAIAKKVFSWDLNIGVHFDILLHLGTLVALIIVFREDIWGMLREFWGMMQTWFVNTLIFFARRKGNTKYKYIKVINSGYRKLIVMVLVSTIPTGLVGYFGKDLVNKATGTLWLVGVCLLITGTLLFLADRHVDGKIKIKDATYSSAFFMGISQGMATMPGLSRSGTTIATGLFLGYNRKLAVKYSFIMSIPAILGAVVFDLKDLNGEAMGSKNLPGYILGTIAAGVVGFFCLKYMLKLVRTKRYMGFAIYCAVIGVTAIILNFAIR